AGVGINQSIDRGEFTVMIRLQNLGDSATTPNQTGIKAAIIGGATFGAGLECGDGGSTLANCLPPKFDGTDVWPLARDTLLNADPANPKVKFDDGFVVGGTWVSGRGSGLELTIVLNTVTVTLPIVSAYVAVEL